jgi:hypothetical protein
VIKLEFCECGSLIFLNDCSNPKCSSKNAKSKKWIIDGYELIFKTEITREEAQEQAPGMISLIKMNITKKSKNDYYSKSDYIARGGLN